MNQCDGCRAGMSLENGLHYDRYGKVQMVCTENRYVNRAIQLADAYEATGLSGHIEVAKEIRKLYEENLRLSKEVSLLKDLLKSFDSDAQ